MHSIEMKCLVLLTVLAFASENKNDAGSAAANLGEKFMENSQDPIVVKIEEDEHDKKKYMSSNYFGVFHNEKHKRWSAQRYTTDKKNVYNGEYRDEEIAAHASDTLARNLMANGGQNLKLNFPDDNTEVYPEERKTSSEYLGVYYKEKFNRWQAQRRSQIEGKVFTNGYYKDELMAAHASDTLARKLMANGEGHKLNFPDNDTKVGPEGTTSSKSFGVCYKKKQKKWAARRWSKTEQKIIFNGANYKDKETAAHASDTLARKLMADGEENHKLNFPDDNTEKYAEEKEKTFEYIGVYYNEKPKLWVAQRWDYSQKKLLKNGYYKDKEIAARASDTLARELMAIGEQNHELNFPDDNTEVHARERKTNSKYFGIYYNEKCKSWIAQRWSRLEGKVFTSGNYKDEETAAHASDTLARELMANGEQFHFLNFPDDNTEVRPKEHQNKRKRSFDFDGIYF